MDLEARIRNVTAVLGPTNTGKTHLAIERMLGHQSGLIGLPLRLLAREVYDKIVARVGADAVALITGEEKIKPDGARYWVCTVEAMPRETNVDFLAIDEVQLAADPERGHVFTDRLLHARGVRETLLLGAGTMRDAISDLIPGAHFISRPRLSKLTYSGEKKITRLPARTAIVTFSANEVYAIAELIRRQRGGAAVVLGALSPRTRNAQVALYQAGEVEYLVATDAIGMGLNLDVDHVAFAGVRKFDGQNFRALSPSEIGQVAGRAGRHMNDGTFGVTADVQSFEPELVERLENHNFEPVRVLQWRSRELDFGSVDRLRESLKAMPREVRLTRARVADDVMALETLSADGEIAGLASGREAVELLWDVCQIPDYRKISTQNHAEMIGQIYRHLRGPDRVIPEDWFAKQVDLANRTDGDIDTLATRLAHIRTWTFVSNRASWLKDPVLWQAKTREIEDTLSDALHEQLTQRFVDRRTSALMRGMRDKEELAADIAEDGAIKVEDHFVGRLKGFRFLPDTQAEGIHGKAARGAAMQVVSKELAMRARRVAAAKGEAFRLSRNGRIVWREDEIARLEPADDHLKPTVVLLADDTLSGPDREKVQARLDAWIVETVSDRLKPLAELAKAEDVTGLARGIAFRLTESFGILKRDAIADEIKSLDQPARAQLRKYGVRFGAFNIYIPLLLKPAVTELRIVLWALKNAGANGLSLEALPTPPRPGLTSVKPETATPEAYYRLAGYHTCGPRAVRIDMLERLADSIRPLLAWRPNPANPGTPPKGATGDGAFTVTPEMMSILGCSSEELGDVLRALGFRSEKKPVKRAAPAAPAPAPAGEAAPAAEVTAEPAAPVDAAAEAQVQVQAQVASGDGAVASEPAAPEQIAAHPVEAAVVPPPVPHEEKATDGTVEAAPAEVSASAEAGVATAIPAEAPAVTDAAPVAAPEAELELVEVWRPKRHHRSSDQQQGRRHRPGRGRQRNGAERRQEGGERPAGTAAATSDGAAAAAPATPEGGEGGGERRRDRDNRHRDRRREEGRGDRPRDAAAQGKDRERDRNRPQGRGGERGDRGDRGDRRRGPERDNRPPQVRSSAPAKRQGPDPDSPFAKLSALKEAMDKQAR